MQKALEKRQAAAEAAKRQEEATRLAEAAKRQEDAASGRGTYVKIISKIE